MVYWWNNCLKKNILQSVPRNVYMYLVHWWKSVWIKHYANFLVIRCSRFSDFIICLSVLGKTISTKEWCIGEITVWEKKTFYHLYQGMLRCAWCIGEITVCTMYYVFCLSKARAYISNAICVFFVLDELRWELIVRLILLILVEFLTITF